MSLNISLTRRVRRRKKKSGEVVEQVRYVLNWRDPRTGAREQRFFARQKDAQERRAELMSDFERGSYTATRSNLTVADAMAAWLEAKRGVVRPNTFASYAFRLRYITGPLPPAEARKAAVLSGTGKMPKAEPIELLGRVKAREITARQIRAWHRTIAEEVSVYTANKALAMLRAALSLAAEDHEFRPPSMPTGLQRQHEKARKAILTVEQAQQLIAAARADQDKGVYYAAPFLLGVRPSELLGLLWDEVDFVNNVVRIRRMRLTNGSLSEMTKTAAGRRDIPMTPLLREMLLEWRVRCPRRDGKLERVFPALGTRRAWPQPPAGGGGPLIYNNYRARIWAPTLKRLGLPHVTPHSARHTFISMLQAGGAEVGLVAKLAGHKNPTVTLAYYTHAVRSGDDAMASLERAFRPAPACAAEAGPG